jgi:hypothetical protein
MHQIPTTDLPREYRASGPWKTFLSICSVLIVGLGIWVGGEALHPVNGGATTTIFLGIISTGFIALGISGAASGFKTKITIFPNSIEITGLLHKKTLGRDEIRGWRITPSTPPTLILQMRESGRRAVKFGLLFPIDHELSAWLDNLPSLDHEELIASAEEIEKSDDYGLTPTQRSENLEKALQHTKVLTIISGLVALWGFLYPHPYPLVITLLSALPWIGLALVWRSNGLVRIDQKKNSVHPTAAYAIIFPPLVLLMRSVFDFDVVFSARLAFISFALGAAVTWCSLIADKSERKMKGAAWILAAFFLRYGFGITIEANALLDHSPGVTYSVVVEGQHINSGKTTSYYLDLAPWGPKSGANELQVSKRTYQAIQRGDIANVELRQGALGVNWYYLDSWHHPEMPVSGK